MEQMTQDTRNQINMLNEIIGMLKPHIVRKDHCTALAERLESLFMDKIEATRNVIRDEAYCEGYDYGFSDGVNESRLEK